MKQKNSKVPLMLAQREAEKLWEQRHDLKGDATKIVNSNRLTGRAELEAVEQQLGYTRKLVASHKAVLKAAQTHWETLKLNSLEGFLEALRTADIWSEYSGLVERNEDWIDKCEALIATAPKLNVVKYGDLH